jgi:hypothetical protein
VAQVDQDPAAVGVALDARPQPRLLGLVDDRVDDRAGLNRRASGDDDERVRDDRASGEIENGDVLGFLVLGGVARERDQIDLRQGCSPVEQ